MNGKIVLLAAALIASVATVPVRADGGASAGVETGFGAEADGTTRLRSSRDKRFGMRNESAAGVTTGESGRAGANVTTDTDASAGAGNDQGPELGTGSQSRGRLTVTPNESKN